MTTGERIKAARKRAGLTQGELAERLGLAASAVTKWETSRHIPKIETLSKIAGALRCDMSDLLCGGESGLREIAPMREIVEKERLRWKAKVYEKIRANEFDSARDKLAVLQGVEFLAEALDLMEGNMNGRFALADLIADAESAYILAQEGE